MIDYNPKDWFKFVFQFHKADTVRKLSPLLISIGIYAGVIAFLMIEVWEVGEKSDLKNISQMHSLLGFVLSMLLVFRTNTAYDRWWEGRKLWGSLVNNSRNLAIKLSSLLDSPLVEERAFFRAMIPNFAFVLKNHLRKRFLDREFEECGLYKTSDLNPDGHLPNQVSQAIFKKVAQLQHDGVLRAEHLLILNTELQIFAEVCGACERIKNTPIPFSYSSFLKKFIFFYCITMPIGYVFSLHYFVVPFVVFIFYVLASLELIAEEIEDPFGVDANDLPTDPLCHGIRKTVHELFD